MKESLRLGKSIVFHKELRGMRGPSLLQGDTDHEILAAVVHRSRRNDCIRSSIECLFRGVATTEPSGLVCGSDD